VLHQQPKHGAIWQYTATELSTSKLSKLAAPACLA